MSVIAWLFTLRSKDELNNVEAAALDAARVEFSERPTSTLSAEITAIKAETKNLHLQLIIFTMDPKA